ncbi:MAG: SIMPL domain-containing protein [Chloroflexota bacterium]|nr:SIMPL domain-containing protein [Chloroflexota bacterium]
MRAMVTAVLILVLAAIAGEAALAYFYASSRAGFGRSAGQAAPAADASSLTITVISDGQAKGSPDVAYLNLGVQTTGSTAQEAINSNSAAMLKVIDRLKALGETDNALQTQGLSVFPISGPQKPGDPSSPERIRGYRANDSLGVTVNDITRAGAVLDGAIQAGANSSGGIRFGLKDDTKLRQEALGQATKAARGRADTIAQALGVRITGLASISEDVTNRPIPYGLGGAQAASAAPIQPGQLTVTTQVRAVYTYAK